MSANEYLLDNVLYIGGMAQITRNVPCDAPLVFDDQRLESFRVARLRKPHEFRILIGDHHGRASIRKRAIRRNRAHCLGVAYLCGSIASGRISVNSGMRSIYCHFLAKRRTLPERFSFIFFSHYWHQKK